MSDQTSKSPETKQPFFMVPGAVTAVVALLAAIHVALQIGGADWQVLSLYAFAFIPERISAFGRYPAIPGSQAWSFLTYALLHSGWQHLIFNCLWFVVFGSVVARQLGAWRFLVLCAISAAAGAAASLIVNWGQGAIMVGASAAVSGAMAAAIPIMYGRRVGPAQVRALAPVELARDTRALFFMGFWLLLTLFSGATGWIGNSFADDFRIAWEAHLGGFAAGLAAFYGLDRGLQGFTSGAGVID